MDLREIVINMRKWVHSAQDRDYWRVLVNAELNLRVLKAMKLVNNINNINNNNNNYSKNSRCSMGKVIKYSGQRFLPHLGLNQGRRNLKHGTLYIIMMCPSFAKDKTYG